MNWKSIFGGLSDEEKKQAAEALNVEGEQGAQPPAKSATQPLATQATIPPQASPDVAALQKKIEEMQAERHQERLDTIAKDGQRFYMAQFQARTVKPAQKESVVSDYVTAATDDLLHPVAEGQTSRVAKLESRYAVMPKHKLTVEEIKDSNLVVLGNADAPDALDEAQKSAEAYAGAEE